jgi:Bax protein
MNQRKIQIVGGLCLMLLVCLIILFQFKSSWIEQIPEVDYASDPVPDFNKYQQLNNKKTAFFNYLLPAVDAQNDYILKVRDYLQGLRAKNVADEALSDEQISQLAWLSEEYRVDEKLTTQQQLDALLKKIDIIPAPLVLVQSANESAWGTSRFAVEGYNFFGMWCFVENCGFVPKKRNAGATHEVAKYDDLSTAMYAYMRNLNRHPAFAELRSIRAKLRNTGQVISATKLVDGLGKYSERGKEYIKELQNMIRLNQKLIPSRTDAAGKL